MTQNWFKVYRRIAWPPNGAVRAVSGRGGWMDLPQDGATNNKELITTCFLANTRDETVLHGQG